MQFNTEKGFVRRPGVPEIYIDKPYLSRQRVAPRRRESQLEKTGSGKEITTMGKFGRVLRWLLWWYPAPIGGNL